MLTPLNPQQTLYVHLLLLQLPVVPSFILTVGYAIGTQKWQ